MHQRKIRLLDLPSLHGKRKLVRCMRVVCGKHNAAGFSVKARDGAKNIRTVGISVGKRVGQGIVIMPMRGMGRHVPAFVAKGHLRILVQNFDREGAGQEVSVALGIRNRERKTIPRV